MTRKQCKATTRNSNRCKNYAKPGYDYCSVHIKKINKEKEDNESAIAGGVLFGIIGLLFGYFLIGGILGTILGGIIGFFVAVTWGHPGKKI